MRPASSFIRSPSVCRSRRRLRVPFLYPPLFCAAPCMQAATFLDTIKSTDWLSLHAGREAEREEEKEGKEGTYAATDFFLGKERRGGRSCLDPSTLSVGSLHFCSPREETW